MADDEDLQDSWTVLERTRFEHSSPHTMNAAEAMERIIHSVEDFYRVFGKTIVDPAITIASVTDGKERTLWGVSLVLRVSTLTDPVTLQSGQMDSIEAAIEHLFHICLGSFQKQLEDNEKEAKILRRQIEEQEHYIRDIKMVMSTMGKYTPYQLNLPDPIGDCTTPNEPV